MIRKLLVVAAAIAMPVSVFAVSGGMASASNPHTAASDTIKCTKLTGTVKFSPKLTDTGYTSGATTTTVNVKLSGCTAAGSFKTKVSGGTVTGTIKGAAGTSSSPSGKCAALTGSNTDAGKLTTKWTATPADAPSVLTVKSVAGGTKSSHGTFTIPGTAKGTATGSFLGSNKGASDKTVAQTTETLTQILASCATGLSSLAIETEPGATPVTLG
ncbi:MAG: hypothetical protein ABSC41_15390 [Acidimicrobiales bacterium]|jgi:hypothetical protein